MPGRSTSLTFLVRRFAALVLAAALAGCAGLPPPHQPVARGDFAAVRQQLQTLIEHERRAGRLAGLSIALVDDQQLVWAHGEGWADEAAGRAAGPDTLYRVGSISKLFTDTAAMQLVAAGRLALDAPIQAVLPDFRIGSRWPDAPITLRQLMTHHAGLPRDQLGGMWGRPVGDFRALLPALADETLAAPPGRSFAYSNLGLNLVGTALERQAGRPFEQVLQQQLLAPLGLDGASFSAAPPALPAMARGHFQGVPRDEPGLRDVPAGGLNASVNHLARFLSMQFAQGRNARGEVVLPAPQWAEMLRVQNAGVALDAGFQVGLGWMFSTFGEDTVHGGGPVAHHGGATFYHRAQLMMLPEQRLGVAVASNDGAAGPAVSRIAQRALALMLEARTGQRPPEPVPGFQPATQPWTEAQRQACVGEYLTDAGVARIEADGARLRARLDGRVVDLLEGEDGRLGLRYRLAGLVRLPLGLFDRIGLQCATVAGHAVLLAHHDGLVLRVGDRLPPPVPVPSSLSSMAGRYEPRAAPGERLTVESVRLYVADGRLWAQPRVADVFGGDQLPPLPLQVLSASQALLAGPLADEGPLISLRRSQDGQQEVAFSGWTFVKVGD